MLCTHDFPPCIFLYLKYLFLSQFCVSTEFLTQSPNRSSFKVVRFPNKILTNSQKSAFMLWIIFSFLKAAENGIIFIFGVQNFWISKQDVCQDVEFMVIPTGVKPGDSS